MKDKKTLLEQKSYSFADLADIVALLRAPDGCPWDREQTHQSIRANMLEEAYEAVEAIDEQNSEHLREELGDVLLQVLLHARIEAEEGRGGIEQVCDELSKKLIFRHPHVFGNVEAANSGEVLAVWDAVKANSRGQTTVAEEMGSVSKALPALTAAHKIGKKGRKAGFDFADFAEAGSKVREELAELDEAVGQGDIDAIEEELGDVYLSLTCAARLAGADSEKALQRANAKFIKRFAVVERLCAADGRALDGLSREEKAAYWDKARKECGRK